jgi:hypothetical protein
MTTVLRRLLFVSQAINFSIIEDHTDMQETIVASGR